ncbi:MAG: hypothetical protein KatS3mg113_0510 [Planctomycetaceae bacterium]|nr:MAG: hypothetical protein KatS3mg113_0510 [Planctomycetaceae bacterium]
MKGPGYRRMEVRRLWICPACGKSRRTEGAVVVMMCACGRWMILREETSSSSWHPQTQLVIPQEMTIEQFDLPPLPPREPGTRSSRQKARPSASSNPDASSDAKQLVPTDDLNAPVDCEVEIDDTDPSRPSADDTHASR